MILNGRNVTLPEPKQFFGAHHKKSNEDRSMLLAAKYRSMILVYRNIRYTLTFAGVPRGGGVKYNTYNGIPTSKLH